MSAINKDNKLLQIKMKMKMKFVEFCPNLIGKLNK